MRQRTGLGVAQNGGLFTLWMVDSVINSGSCWFLRVVKWLMMVHDGGLMMVHDGLMILSILDQFTNGDQTWLLPTKSVKNHCRLWNHLGDTQLMWFNMLGQFNWQPENRLQCTGTSNHQALTPQSLITSLIFWVAGVSDHETLGI